ncbi:MAG: hypothetical protein JW873_00715 [Candidatus Saganbacteria bacterium]|nr:hypothetical protein [Candidatus Saganbacteria bacterium]
MIHYIGLIIGLLLTFCLGNVVLSFIDRDKKLALPEYLALSFLAGVSFTGLLVFLSFFLAIPGRVFVLGALIVMAFAARFVAAKESERYLPLKPVKLPPKINWSWRTLAWLFLSALLASTFLYVFVETCSKPEYSWDTCGHWTAPAVNLFYFEKVIPQNTFKAMLEFGGNYYYPKQLTNMHYWLFGWMGVADDQWSKLFFPLALLCFVTIFYSALRKVKGPLGALFFTTVLLSSPFIVYLATIGYADVSVGLYFSTGIIFFYRWLKEGDDVHFWLFSLFVALTTWVKLEGKPLYLLGLAVLLVYLGKDFHGSLKEKAVRCGQYFAAYALTGLPWQLFLFFNHIHTRERLANYLGYALEMQRQVYELLFLQGTWGLVPLLLLATVVVFFKRALRRENFYLLLTLLLFYALILFLYLFTLDTYFMLESGFNRHWIMVYPVSVFTLACLTPSWREFWSGDDG